MRMFKSLATITLFITSNLLCMDQQPAPLTPQQQENAGLFGQLAPDTLIHLASFCTPASRCNVRCTGKYLNRQLQGENCPTELQKKDKLFVLCQRRIKQQALKQEIITHCDKIAKGRNIIHKVCYWTDWISGVLACPATALQIYRFAKGGPLNKSLFLLSTLTSSIWFGQAYVDGKWGLDSRFCGLCTLLIKEPAAYLYSFGIHLYNKNSIIKKAKKCCFYKDELKQSVLYNANLYDHLLDLQSRSAGPRSFGDTSYYLTAIERIGIAIYKTIPYNEPITTFLAGRFCVRTGKNSILSQMPPDIVRRIAQKASR